MGAIADVKRVDLTMALSWRKRIDKDVRSKREDPDRTKLGTLVPKREAPFVIPK